MAMATEALHRGSIESVFGGLMAKDNPADPATKRPRGRPAITAEPLRSPTPAELEAFMVEMDWNNAEMARQVGVTRAMPGHWLSGRSPIPPYITVLMTAFRQLKKRGPGRPRKDA